MMMMVWETVRKVLDWSEVVAEGEGGVVVVVHDSWFAELSELVSFLQRQERVYERFVWIGKMARTFGMFDMQI